MEALAKLPLDDLDLDQAAGTGHGNEGHTRCLGDINDLREGLLRFQNFAAAEVGHSQERQRADPPNGVITPHLLKNLLGVFLGLSHITAYHGVRGSIGNYHVQHLLRVGEARILAKRHLQFVEHPCRGRPVPRGEEEPRREKP